MKKAYLPTNIHNIFNSAKAYMEGRKPALSFKESRKHLKELQKIALAQGIIKNFGGTGKMRSWSDIKEQARILSKVAS